MQEGRESFYRCSIQKQRMEFHEKAAAFFGSSEFVHVSVEITELSQKTGQPVNNQ